MGIYKNNTHGFCDVTREVWAWRDAGKEIPLPFGS